jgi:hypothetical protein
MSRDDPFDELGVDPGASEDQLQHAYRRRVVERHRHGVWRIVDQLRRAQRAFGALSDPAVHERYRREREQRERERLKRERERGDDYSTLQDRQLQILRNYKSKINSDLERIGAENRERHSEQLAEIDRQIALEELRSRELIRRPRLSAHVRNALLLALLLALAAALWLGLRGS